MAYDSELRRLASFVDWPTSTTSIASPCVLSRRGFYYSGHGTAVVCCRCQLELEGWRNVDELLEQHRVRSPDCHLGGTTSTVQPNTGDEIRLGGSTSVHRPPHRDYSAGTDTTKSNNGTSAQAPSKGRLRRSQNVRQVKTESVAAAVRHGQTTAPPVSAANVTAQVRRTFDRFSPDFDQLRSERVRLETFDDWPPRAARVVDPRDLAEAGLFYTGQRDRVQCAFCRGFLRNWIRGDRPADEHRKHFPDCPFVRGTDVGNVAHDNVRLARNSRLPGDFRKKRWSEITGCRTMSPAEAAVRAALRMGFDRELVKAVVERHLRASGREFSSATRLVEAIIDHQEGNERAVVQAQTERSDLDNMSVQSVSVSVSDDEDYPTQVYDGDDDE